MRRESPNYENYDYVVLEFDSDRLFEKASTYDSSLADRVARGLKPYYENNSIIWVVGNSPSDNPWGWITKNVQVNDEFWYTPTSWNKDNTSGMPVSGTWNYVVALLDPELYLEKPNGQRYASTLTSGGRTFYAAHKYETQVTYNDPDAVLNLLNNTIKVKPYNLNLRDKIKHGDSGLTIDGVTIQACLTGEGDKPSTDLADWTDLMMCHVDTGTFEWLDKSHVTGIEGGYMTVDMASNVVNAVISNVDFTVWTRVNIGIVDDGRFRTSEDAYYNESTGKWEKNPNDDPNFPGLHFNSGVEDVNRQYDGTGTNIVVTVNVPEDASRFKIYYTTDMTGEVEWSETNPVFTNVCDQAVWYRIEAVGDWAKDYLWVTNFARVVITPRTATVTANAATTSQGATEQPPYTATVACTCSSSRRSASRWRSRLRPG